MKYVFVSLLILLTFVSGNVVSRAKNQTAGFPDKAQYQSTVLSKDYKIFREWSGGNSCCLIFHVFQTKPVFKKILQHSNDFFDATEIVVGPHLLEFHRYDLKKQPNHLKGLFAHFGLKYNPSIFDLKKRCWIKADGVCE